MPAAEKRVLILGVGNTLLADEGFGVRAADYMAANYHWPPNVRILDGGTLGLLLLGELMECDLLIALDIALLGAKPGTFFRIEGKDFGKSLSLRQSAHQTSLADTLISCDLAGHRPEAVIFAMQPWQCRQLRASLSPDAQNMLPVFCQRVVREIAPLGIAATCKQ